MAEEIKPESDHIKESLLNIRNEMAGELLQKTAPFSSPKNVEATVKQCFDLADELMYQVATNESPRIMEVLKIVGDDLSKFGS